MTCKACGQPFGCNHSDAEYQGVVPPMIERRSRLDQQVEQFVAAVQLAAKQVGEAFRR